MSSGDGVDAVRATIDAALTGPSGTIGEVPAKEVLRLLGVTVTEGRLCYSEEEALQAMHELEPPVVLKAASPAILHKSDYGAVKVGLHTADQVRDAYRAIRSVLHAQDAAADPVLVDKMVTGTELLIGATATPFGPVVLLGLGGVFTEGVRAFAARWLGEDSDADGIMDEIAGGVLVSGGRALAPFAREQVYEAVRVVGRLLRDFPEIAEIDLNPIMVDDTNARVADARIVVRAPAVEEERGPTPAHLDELFQPSSVAVVGATTGRYNRGRAWLRSARANGYAGQLSAVSRKAAVDSFHTVASLSDLAERPDLVMAEVSAAAVPAILDECQALAIPWLVVRATGFGENGDEGGHTLGQQLASMVAKGPTRLVGPGALGPCCPGIGIVPGVTLPPHGGVGVLSQSGVMLTGICNMAESRGFGISHGISYGQEMDVPVSSYLRFLATDPQTDVVVCYLEGTRDPRDFASALRDCARAKPVLLLKGGLSKTGAVAARSHTGALSTRAVEWRALAASTGAYLMSDLDELIDHVVAFNRVPDFTGRRLAFVTPSGGAGVLFADECDRQGFELAGLSGQTREWLAGRLGGAVNPIDVGNAYFDSSLLAECLRMLASDDTTDLLVFHLATDMFGNQATFSPWIESPFLDAIRQGGAGRLGKPLVVLAPYMSHDGKREETAKSLGASGVPVFSSARGLLAAFAHVVARNRRLSWTGSAR